MADSDLASAPSTRWTGIAIGFLDRTRWLHRLRLLEEYTHGCRALVFGHEVDNAVTHALRTNQIDPVRHVRAQDAARLAWRWLAD